MKLSLSDARKEQYRSILETTREIEVTIGSTQYRLYKLTKTREDMDGSIKKWWEEIQEEMSLDKNKDYSIDLDGTITEIDNKVKKEKVEKTVTPTDAPTTIEELK